MTTLDRRWTSRHEAGHVAAMILTVRRLPEITHADKPHDLAYGSTVFPWPEGRATQDLLGEFAVSVMAGPLAVGDSIPDWPPDRQARGDERQLAAAVSLGNLDEDGWHELVEQARAMARSPEFTRLVDLIARALELNETLTDDDLRRLLGPDRLAELGITE